jgi:uncharacterized protein
MECRPNCGACCIEPGITRAFLDMPDGKPAGVRCLHLLPDSRCGLFGDPRRPAACHAFMPEPSICGNSQDEARLLLRLLERTTTTVA